MNSILRIVLPLADNRNEERDPFSNYVRRSGRCQFNKVRLKVTSRPLVSTYYASGPELVSASSLARSTLWRVTGHKAKGDVALGGGLKETVLVQRSKPNIF